MRELKAFIAVFEAGSYTVAASRLCVTQPAISKRIQQLEEQLKQKLFERLGQKMQPTEAAKALYPHAKQLQQSLQNAYDAVFALEDKVQGELNIASSPYVALYHLPAILQAYQKQYPDVTLNIRIHPSHKVQALVTQGEVDIGYLTKPQCPLNELNIKPLCQEAMKLVVRRDHPLIHQDQVSIDDLFQYPLIASEVGTSHYDFIFEYFLKKQQCSPMVAFPINSLEMIKKMLAIALGWSLLPVSLIDGDLDVLNLLDAPLYYELCSITHQTLTLSTACEKLWLFETR